MSSKVGVVYITPRGNLFVAPEGLTGKAYDEKVVEMFGEDELTPCDRPNVFTVEED